MTFVLRILQLTFPRNRIFQTIDALIIAHNKTDYLKFISRVLQEKKGKTLLSGKSRFKLDRGNFRLTNWTLNIVKLFSLNISEDIEDTLTKKFMHIFIK